MKYVISFLFSLSVHALPIKIHHESKLDAANSVKSIFMKTYKIPEDLIAITEVKNCEALTSRGKLDLCLKNNGDLQVVSVDRGFINESLKIFQAP